MMISNNFTILKLESLLSEGTVLLYFFDFQAKIRTYRGILEFGGPGLLTPILSCLLR